MVGCRAKASSSPLCPTGRPAVGRQLDFFPSQMTRSRPLDLSREPTLDVHLVWHLQFVITFPKLMARIEPMVGRERINRGIAV
jgi:hypothetical protein